MNTSRKEVLGKGTENLTTLVSVSLLLLIAGIAIALTLAGRNEKNRLYGKVEMVIVMSDTVSDAQALALAEKLSGKFYVARATAVSRNEAMKRWEETTGENLQEVFGINPLSPEIILHLKSRYVSTSDMQTLADGLESLPGVEGVALPNAQMIEDMNTTITGIIRILALLWLVLIVITLTLINNTVHLGIYSRRFAIRTMQLVGATDAFIRHPFLVQNATMGLLSGLIAAGLLTAGAMSFISASGMNMKQVMPMPTLLLIDAGLLAGGVLICTGAAWIATRRFLKIKTDMLFN